MNNPDACAVCCRTGKSVCLGIHYHKSIFPCCSRIVCCLCLLSKRDKEHLGRILKTKIGYYLLGLPYLHDDMFMHVGIPHVYSFFFSAQKNPTKITVYLYIIKCVLRYTCLFCPFWFGKIQKQLFSVFCKLFSIKYLKTVITWLTWLWKYNTRTHEQEENLQATHGKPEHCVSFTIRLSVKVGTLRSSLPGSN